MRAGLGLVVGAALLAGCGASKPDTGLRKIRVAIQPFLAYAPLLIAEAEGYFREAGLEVEFVKVNRTQDALPALLQGDLDVLPGTAASAVLTAMARGERLRFVADKGYLAPDTCSSTTIVVRADFPLAEARTKLRRITVSRDAPTRYLVSRALASQGIELDSLETVRLPDGVDADALRSGAIDATAGGEPWQTQLRRRIAVTPWLEIEKFLPDQQYSYIIFGQSLLDTDRAAGTRFLAAFRRGVAQYRRGPTERNLDLLVASTGEERSILEEACWPAIRPNGRINLPSLLTYQRWAKEHGFIDLEATSEQMWDSTLLAASDALLPADGPRP
jgi:NitT/TauT family transport system substrate-binding protein